MGHPLGTMMPTMDSAIGQAVINSLAAWRQIGPTAAAPEGGWDTLSGWKTDFPEPRFRCKRAGRNGRTDACLCLSLINPCDAAERCLCLINKRDTAYAFPWTLARRPQRCEVGQRYLGLDRGPKISLGNQRVWHPLCPLCDQQTRVGPPCYLTGKLCVTVYPPLPMQ